MCNRSMLAVIRSGGKQYSVESGTVIKTEKVVGEVGDVIEMSDVVMCDDGGVVRYGANSCQVKARVLKQCRDDKIIVFKYRRRKDSRTKNGHRQSISILKIEEISINS